MFMNPGDLAAFNVANVKNNEHEELSKMRPERVRPEQGKPVCSRLERDKPYQGKPNRSNPS